MPTALAHEVNEGVAGAHTHDHCHLRRTSIRFAAHEHHHIHLNDIKADARLNEHTHPRVHAHLPWELLDPA
ncbi:MAG: hypothetical protein E6J42_00640 [Chloroflexi bacterium]|nr:MAG: hypothetical protein E6J42_00640 [Chloroflexota bacterium]